MSTPNPITPNGSNLEQSGKAKSFPYAVALMTALHVFGLGGLLLIGCSRSSDTTRTETTPAPVVDPVIPPPLETPNPPIVPPVDTGLSAGTGAVTTTPPAGGGSGVSPTGSANAVNSDPTSPAPILSSEPTPTPTTAGEYKIAKGDIAANIAKKSGISLAALQAANPGVNLAKIKPGQVIQVPTATAPAPTPKVENETAAPKAAGGVHVVKSGDNLNRIAKAHGVSVKAIRAANGLRSDVIRVGQKLKIPAASGTAAKSVSPGAVAAPVENTIPVAIPVPNNPSPNQP